VAAIVSSGLLGENEDTPPDPLARDAQPGVKPGERRNARILAEPPGRRGIAAKDEGDLAISV
jgi:hypothetical protein